MTNGDTVILHIYDCPLKECLEVFLLIFFELIDWIKFLTSLGYFLDVIFVLRSAEGIALRLFTFSSCLDLRQTFKVPWMKKVSDVLSALW